MSESVDPDEDQVPGLRPDGTADPAYAAALGLVPVSPGKRSLSFAIDAAIVVILVLPAFIGAFGILGAILDASAKATAAATAAPGAGGGEVALDFGSLILPLVLFGVGEFLVSVYYIVQLILHGLRGLTIGKAICGIRSVRVTTLARPGFWRVVLRAVVFYAAAVIVPVLGAIPFLLSPLWDPEGRGRGWLDRIGGNWLVDIRTGLDPYNTKAMRLARKRVAAPPKVEAAPLPSLATGSGTPTFVPETRSSSGVIGVAENRHADAAAGGSWTPPPIGPAQTPAGQPAAAAAPVSAAAAPPAPTAPPSSEAAPPTAPTPASADTITAQPTLSEPPARDPGTAQPPSPAHAPTAATFIFDDGTSMIVTGNGLLGRNPQPRAGEEVHHIIPVRDERLQISKTHAEFGFDDDGVWISDRSSVNGTQLIDASGRRIEIPVGEHYPVAWGSVVEVGGRAFRVVRQATDATDAPPRPPHTQDSE